MPLWNTKSFALTALYVFLQNENKGEGDNFSYPIVILIHQTEAFSQQIHACPLLVEKVR